MDIKSITKCPTCASEVTVGGKGETHYYIPVKDDAARWRELATTFQQQRDECHKREVELEKERDDLAAKLEGITVKFWVAQASHCECCPGHTAQAGELERYKQGHDRYEKIRLLNPREFSEIFCRGLAGENFDAMVDALESTSAGGGK